MLAAAPRLAASSAYRGNIWRLFAVQALLMFILWVPIWVVFLQRKGLGLTQIGLLEVFAWVLTAALEVPSGAIADRVGRKASIALGAFLYSVAMFLILADALSPAFLLGYALWNSSTAFVSGADSALPYDSLKAGGRTSEGAKQSGRHAAIQQASQCIASVLRASAAICDRRRAAARIARHHRARRADDHGRGFVARAQSWRTLGPHDHRRGRRRGPPRRDRDPRSVPIGPVSRTHARGRPRT